MEYTNTQNTLGGVGKGDLREGATPQGEGSSAGEAEVDGGGEEQGGS